MVVSISDTFVKRAEKAKCLSQMRTLHTAFVSHIEDKGQWPQLPEDEPNWSESKFYGFWVRALEPYGTSQDTWICPSDKVYADIKKDKTKQLRDDDYFGSYVPTPFDENPATPFRWSQPWVVERGDYHGKGSHMLMPDGSIQDKNNPFYSR